MSEKKSKKSIPNIPEFGERLKKAFNGVTNVSIAGEMGLNKSTLTFYMKGRVPTADKLIEISRLTNCNLHWLLTGEGSRRIVAPTERPQGIIVQTNTSRAETSRTALYVAAALALKGYGVLYVDDKSQRAAKMFYPETDVPEARIRDNGAETTEFSEPTNNASVENHQTDYFLATNNKKLDIFFPLTGANNFPAKEKLKIFNFDAAHLYKKYQFVIFNVQGRENLLYEENSGYRQSESEQVLKYFVLEPILRNAQVIIPLDVIRSESTDVQDTIKQINSQRRIYPEAGLAGIFLCKPKYLNQSQQDIYEEKLTNLSKLFGSSILKTRINFDFQSEKSEKETKKWLFNRRTGNYRKFTKLVDELLKKINYTPDER